MRRSKRYLVKSAKVFLRVVAFLVLLAVSALTGALVVFHVMVTPDGLKSIVVSELQNTLHRPVEVQHVSLLIFQGIRVRGLRVIEAPGFPGPNILSSDVLLARYKWKALLMKRLEFSELRLVSPRIQLIRREDARWNIEDLFASSDTAHARAKAGQFSLPGSLTADLISIDNGVVTVKDIPRQRQYSFHDINLKVWGFDPAHSFAFDARFENSNQIAGKKLHTAFSIKGVIALAGFKWEDASFSAEKIRWTVGGKTLTASGTVKNFRHPAIDVQSRIPSLDSNALALYNLKIPEVVSIPATRWSAQLSFPSTGQLRLDSVDVEAEPLRVHAKGFYRLSSPHRWRLTASLPPVPLVRIGSLWRGWSKYKLSGTASANVNLSGEWGGASNKVRIERFSVMTKDLSGVFFKAGHRLSHVDLNVSGGNNLQSLAFSVARGAVSIHATTLADLNVAARVHKGDLDIERLHATWGASHVKLKGTVQDWISPKEVRLDGAADVLRLDRAIEEITQLVQKFRAPGAKPKQGPWSRIFKYSIPKTFPSIAGRLNIASVVHPSFETREFSMLWNLRGISTGLRKANGSIRVGFGPGRATDIPTLQASHKILRVLFLPFVFMHKLNNMTVISAATAYPKTLDFVRISGEYGLKAGVVRMRLFHVDSEVLKAFADGIIDFPKEKIDMHVLTRMNQSRGPLPETLTDEKGRPSIGFFVEDDLNKPTLRIDVRKLEEGGIEKAVQRARQHALPDLKMLEGGQP